MLAAAQDPGGAGGNLSRVEPELQPGGADRAFRSQNDGTTISAGPLARQAPARLPGLGSTPGGNAARLGGNFARDAQRLVHDPAGASPSRGGRQSAGLGDSNGRPSG